MHGIDAMRRTPSEYFPYESSLILDKNPFQRVFMQDSFGIVCRRRGTVIAYPEQQKNAAEVFLRQRAFGVTLITS